MHFRRVFVEKAEKNGVLFSAESALLSAVQRYSAGGKFKTAAAAHRTQGNTLQNQYQIRPRQRLPAESIRDQALFVSGLLKERLGGPSVKPYQPEGLWEETSMPQSNTRSYAQGQGDDLWRRSLYTYWKRASPPPSMLALDAPTREFCTVRRFTTNTPLQSLVLWNDPQFVEAARVTAERTLREPGDDHARLARLWTRVTGHPADDARVSMLAEALSAERLRWGGSGAADAAKLVEVGAAPLAPGLDAPEVAAWTMVCHAILASDASIVKD